MITTTAEGKKQAIRESSLRYYNKNKDAVLARAKTYYEANKKKISDKRRKYYQENKEKCSKRIRDYQRRAKEKVLSTCKPINAFLQTAAKHVREGSPRLPQGTSTILHL